MEAFFPNQLLAIPARKICIIKLNEQNSNGDEKENRAKI